MAYPVALVREGCTFTVTIRIHLRRCGHGEEPRTCRGAGPPTEEELALLPAKWKEAIERYWNGPGGFLMRGACKVRVCAEIAAEEFDEIPEEWHDITVHRSTSDRSTSDSGPGQAQGDWGLDDSDAVVAHEVGHLLGGLPEEYEYVTEDETAPCNDDPPVSIMGSISGEVAVRDYHIEALFREWKCYDPAAFQTDCPTACRTWLLRWVAGLLWFLRGVKFPDVCGEPYSTNNYGVHGTKTRGCDEVPSPLEPPLTPDAPDAFARIATGRAVAVRDGLRALANQVGYAHKLDEILAGAEHQNSIVRWAVAAVVEESRDAKVEPVLLRLLGDPSRSVRVRAAQTLLERGRKEGLSVLIAALSDDGPKYGHPPRRANEYAFLVLKAYSGQEFGYRPDAPIRENLQAVARWRRWESDGGEPAPRR